jgi:hypothetical protein
MNRPIRWQAKLPSILRRCGEGLQGINQPSTVHVSKKLYFLFFTAVFRALWDVHRARLDYLMFIGIRWHMAGIGSRRDVHTKRNVEPEGPEHTIACGKALLDVTCHLNGGSPIPNAPDVLVQFLRDFLNLRQELHVNGWARDYQKVRSTVNKLTVTFDQLTNVTIIGNDLSASFGMVVSCMYGTYY